MTEKTDRRQARTKQLLRKALLELMAEQSADSITVTDIAARADVNRGTFYLHYRDVPDMLDRLKDEVYQLIESRVAMLNPRELSSYAQRSEPYPHIVKLFEELSRHADFLKPMLGPHGDLAYAIRLREMMGRYLFRNLNALVPSSEHPLVPRDYLIAYMASANFGVLLHWLETDLQLSPYQMSVMLTQIINRGPLVAAGLTAKP